MPESKTRKKTQTKSKSRTTKTNVESKKDLTLTKAEATNILRIMYSARRIDRKALNLLRQGKTFFHIAGAGHEAIQTAIGLNLNPKEDWLFPYYRDIALVLSAGITPKDFFLQCYAKEDDPSGGGRQLPCHWGAKHLNIPAQSSPTGTQFLQAVGTALASKRKGINNVTYVSSGEGTTSQGEFHEAVNWASREKLPVMFVVQNNKYAISVHVSKQTGGRKMSVAQMMSGYENLKLIHVDGTSYKESLQATNEAIEYIKSGKGPVLVEADVIRLESHSSSDDQRKYRPEDELEEEKKRDPIVQFTTHIIEANILNEKEIEKIKTEVDEEINNSADEAAESDAPDPETCTTHIFEEDGITEHLEFEKIEPDGNKIVMVDAINHALHEEMERNNDIYVFGEDIADSKGGVFTATKGLSTKFGEDRVFNSPLAEASIAGVACGMALTGLKPVVEIQFGDYIWPAFMQIKNEIATYRYRSNNIWQAPVVTRVAVGGYIHGGLYHSQNIEAFFAHIPGLYVVYPSNAADAKGLLKTAIRMDDPVIFCEHKGLYRQSFATSPEPDSEYLLPFGKAKIVKEGTDVTVVTYGLSVWDTWFAAKRLEQEGYSVEIVDIRTIIPLDEETIYHSVKKTNKVIVIHEDTLTGGFGAEIAAKISENCFQHLDGPVRRLAAKDSHIPYAPNLESAVLPSRDQIYKAILDLIRF